MLWVTVAALLEELNTNDTLRGACIYIYTGDVKMSRREILEGVENKFSISIPERHWDTARIQFVYIRSRFLLEAHWYDPPPDPTELDRCTFIVLL